MPKITIAIDGHSSTGKSTVARQLADYLDYLFVDTGAMYRAVTLFALRKGYISENHFDQAGLIEALSQVELEFVKNEEGVSEIHLNGENVEKAIRTLEVSEFVSPVSTISEVRKKLVEQQRKLDKGQGLVMDGRDIGTVVFPKAQLKIFMTAAPEVRARRRYDELTARGHQLSFEEVFENVMERDRIDSTREDSPLRKAADAIEMDNSETNQEDQFHIILQLAKDRIAGRI
ncbi:MAG: (d)CMP kinase [Flavobacteriaceae bacterium]|nr:(d)CMP kinase [Flavobacteriaceae bacterium]